MHKTHIFDHKKNAKKIFLPTYLPYFVFARYRKQTTFFLGLSTTHVLSGFLHYFVLAKLAPSSIRVNVYMWLWEWLETQTFEEYV